MEKLKELGLDDKFGMLYDAEIVQKKEVSSVRKEGRKEGAKEREKSIAKNLLKMNLSVKDNLKNNYIVHGYVCLERSERNVGL